LNKDISVGICIVGKDAVSITLGVSLLEINSFARENEAKSPKVSSKPSIYFIFTLKLNKTNSQTIGF
jgi:hypothetical protein